MSEEKTSQEMPGWMKADRARSTGQKLVVLIGIAVVLGLIGFAVRGCGEPGGVATESGNVALVNPRASAELERRAQADALAIAQEEEKQELLKRLEQEALAAKRREREAEMRAERQRILDEARRNRNDDSFRSRFGNRQSREEETPKALSLEVPGSGSRATPAPKVERSRKPRRATRSRRQVETYEIPRGTVAQARLSHDVTHHSVGHLIRARLVFPVRDRFGRIVLPAQSEVIGKQVGLPRPGYNRLEVIWDEAVLPGKARHVRLSYPATDGDGTGGVGAKVSHRWASFYGHAALLSVIGAAAQAAQRPSQNGDFFDEAAIAGFSERAEGLTERAAGRLENRPPKVFVGQGKLVGIEFSDRLAVEEVVGP